MSAKQAINDKLQGSVATCLRCSGVVNNQIRKGLLLSLSVKFFFKSVNISQSYEQERNISKLSELFGVMLCRLLRCGSVVVKKLTEMPTSMNVN